MAEGKKSRKLGRNSKRPAQQRYRFELRMDKNKRLNIEAAAQQRKDDMHKYRAFPRGMARALRRAANVGLMPGWDLKASFL